MEFLGYLLALIMLPIALAPIFMIFYGLFSGVKAIGGGVSRFMGDTSKEQTLMEIGAMLAQSSIDLRNGDLHSSMSRRNQAKNKLMKYCLEDSEVKPVLERHDANEETLRTLFAQLQTIGAGQHASGHYVAASTLAYPETLDYVLQHFESAKDTKLRMAHNLIEYFRSERKGSLPPLSS